MLPLRAAYKLATLLMHSLDTQLVATHVERSAVAATKAVPDILLYCLRYAYPYPLDDLFFLCSPPAIARMATLKGRPSSLTRFRLFVKRAARLAILVLVQALCFRILGRWTSYIASGLVMYTALGYKGTLVTIALTSVTSVTAGGVVTALVRVRALAREIMDPYLSRSKLDDKQRREWFRKHRYTVAAFTFPFYLAMQIPYLGCLAFGLAMASSPLLCTGIMHTADLYDGP
ncbi:hypothetical protein SeLEV6574_g06102 [Synchytrium endobioticum]|uniref:Uncharacterized protein n=1 Tax=Synchytrium endobioticum TaxID=286115 RepID=A0A507CQM5_9FUNG|nr:hypothetical protein SeLEV6574_g06102 [Synchytrium endobioticum]